jgi:nucleoside-diphosphate-sugar epimerase
VQKQLAAVNGHAWGIRNVYGTVRLNDETPFRMTAIPKNACRIVSIHDTETLCQIGASCSRILVTIPPPRSDPEIDAFLNHLYDNLVIMLPKHAWIGVLSTTGVYGNHNGAWITEDTDTHSCPENLKHYLKMEETWKQRVKNPTTLQYDHYLCIFRCAGIYGADRSALHTIFKNGVPLPIQSESESKNIPKNDITNRIHVEDLAAVIVAAMKKATNHYNVPGAVRVYNVADDCPESRAVVMQHAAHLLQSTVGAGMKKNENPKVQSTDNRAVRRAQDQKRVSNQRMKDEIICNQSLKYPTYKEGLQEILLDKTNPWWQEA